jgi:hypothetical protein
MTICYEEPTTANIVVASILIGGIALSYVPQVSVKNISFNVPLIITLEY